MGKTIRIIVLCNVSVLKHDRDGYKQRKIDYESQLDNFFFGCVLIVPLKWSRRIDRNPTQNAWAKNTGP